MDNEVRPDNEAFPTNMAGERPFPCVSSLVDGENRASGKTLATVGAGERLIFPVALFVLLKRRPVLEALPAH